MRNFVLAALESGSGRLRGSRHDPTYSSAACTQVFHAELKSSWLCDMLAQLGREVLNKVFRTISHPSASFKLCKPSLSIGVILTRRSPKCTHGSKRVEPKEQARQRHGKVFSNPTCMQTKKSIRVALDCAARLQSTKSMHVAPHCACAS